MSMETPGPWSPGEIDLNVYTRDEESSSFIKMTCQEPNKSLL